MSGTYSRAAAAAIFTLLLSAPQAYAHVTLETQQAPVESLYKAVLRVPHGCKGSPTTEIKVRIPEGVIGVKPQPKEGWKLSTVKGDYAKSYTLYGAHVSSGIKEISWTGGPLLDEHYDEFVFIAYLSSALVPNTTLYFPVVQECVNGVARWIDVPEAGEKPASDDHAGSPAPRVKMLPKALTQPNGGHLKATEVGRK